MNIPISPSAVFLYLVMIISWVAGCVLAKGFWSTFCCIFAPWAWYLVIEKVMIIFGVI